MRYSGVRPSLTTAVSGTPANPPRRIELHVHPDIAVLVLLTRLAGRTIGLGVQGPQHPRRQREERTVHGQQLAYQFVEPRLVRPHADPRPQVREQRRQQSGIEQGVRVADGAVRQAWQAVLAAGAGVVEDVLDAAQALEGRTEEGHQVGDQQVLGEERTVAVLVSATEGMEQVLQGLQQSPGNEVLLAARDGLGGALGWPCFARHGASKTPRRAWRNPNIYLTCKILASRTALSRSSAATAQPKTR